MQGYSPIATGRLLDDAEVGEMAKKYDVSIAQLCIKYVLQHEILPLPKSANNERIIQNTQLAFTISDEDMIYLDGIKK
ncbi:MAG: aldo/keto reductase [Turicibacter sp.]|nr:aldo/keto reductase [Turicibacter sp.]